MKKLYLLLAFAMVTLASCTKEVAVPVEGDAYQWMRTHDKGTVAYVDYSSGNYIVQSYGSYSVVESWGSITPREYDIEYAYFGNRGMQSTYNYTGDYFTRINVVDTYLSWSQALYVLDHLAY